MKLRILKLTPENLAQLLLGKGSTDANLPGDLEVLDVKADLFSKQVSIMVRSDSFPDIAEAMPIPEFTFAATFESKPVLAAPVAAKSVAKVEPKPTTVKSTLPSADRYAAKMENEFSPDQRKLLSFTVKGEVVVVKPVTFLKAEWEDINEVVRSLGGKWVKGDIISYWEIPLQ